MNYRELYAWADLLPDSYVAANARRVQRRWRIAGFVVTVGLLVGWTAALSERQQALQGELAEAEQTLHAAALQHAAAQRLSEQTAELAHQVELQQTLTPSITASRVLDTIGALTPTSVTLLGLEVETRGSDGADRNPPLMLVRLRGMAPSERVVGNFAGRLTGSGLFEQVRTLRSTADQFGRTPVRRFELRLEVPLARDYRIQVVEEVAHVR